MRININNFQAVSSLSFDISGLTVMVGQNDIGKSSTYRAIQAAFRNKKGDYFIRQDKGSTSVGISYNSTDLVWSKTRKRSATYTFNGQSFDNVQDTPPFIDDLGMGLIHLKSGTLDPHFSSQKEPPFLLFSSGQILTEFFSEFLKFGPLGRATVQSKKDLRKALSLVSVHEVEVQRFEYFLDKFDFIPEAEASLSDLDTQLGKLLELESTLDLLKSYKEIGDVLTSYRSPDIQPLIDLSFQIEGLIQDIYLIREYIQVLDSPSNFELSFVPEIAEILILHEKGLAFEEFSQSLDKLDKIPILIDFLQVIISINSQESILFNLAKGIPDIDSDLNIAEFLQSEVSYLESVQDLNQVLDDLKAQEDAFKSCLEELGSCPTCGVSTKLLEVSHV